MKNEGKSFSLNQKLSFSLFFTFFSLLKGHYSIENFKIGDDEDDADGKKSTLQSFNFGRYRIEIKLSTMTMTEASSTQEVEVMKLSFNFHGSQ